jgi:glutamate-1-semialdehyde 2,1-aminomutase
MPADFRQAYLARRPKSVQYQQRARQVLAGGVGHDLRHFEPVPLCIARARAGRKWDVDGNEYIDFLLGNGAMLLGHADPEICEAVSRAVHDGSHFGNDHPLHIEWAEWVCRLVPSAERVRFVSSGTEATHLALRLARAWTRKGTVLRFEGHFHGWHDEVVHGFQPPFEADGSLGTAPHARDNLVMIPDGNLQLLEHTLHEFRDIAAAIVEPSGASWGRVPMTGEFLRGLRELTQRFGVVLIFDEVVSGFRFSPGGVQQSAGVTPDLTCLAKVLAGGMPGGAVAGRAAIMNLFDQTGDPRHDRHERVVHQGTFNAAQPSAAAGVVALRRISTGEPIRRANALAGFLRLAWDDVLERHGVAGYVYGSASTFHVYFEANPQRLAGKTSRHELATCDARLLKGMPATLIDQYQRHLRYRGVDIMSSTGGVLSCAHTEEDISTATAAFEETVIELGKEGLIRTLRG